MYREPEEGVGEKLEILLEVFSPGSVGEGSGSRDGEGGVVVVSLLTM